MSKGVLALAAAMWVASAAWSLPPHAQGLEKIAPPSSPAPAGSAATYRPIIDKYCVGCHNDRTKTAGLSLDKMDLSKVADGADVWEKVVRKVRVGMMPPSGASRPDSTTRQSLVSWLSSELDRAGAAHPNPGRGLIHRLNRTEYANAIRDLFTLDIDPSSMLPPDDSAYGFDNIADALGVSPVLL